MAQAEDASAPWWGPVGAPPCAAPGWAVRRDEAVDPRVRPLSVVLAEARVETPDPPAGAVPAGSGPPPAGPDGPRPDSAGPDSAGPDTAGLAAARATAVRVVGAVAETASGRRPAHHLATIVDDATRDALAAPLCALAGRATRAGPVRVVGVSAGAVEVSATLHGPTRSRALAARLERDPAGPAWRVRLLVLL